MRNSGVLDAIPDFGLFVVVEFLMLVFEFYSLLNSVSGLEGCNCGCGFALATCLFGDVGVGVKWVNVSVDGIQ